MATLLNSQIIAEQYKGDSDGLKEAGALIQPGYQVFPDEYMSAVDALRYAEIKNTQNAAMFLSQTISQRYKEVSEFISSIETRKCNVKKKSVKELMHQSFYHGASWIGSNFIA